MVTETASEAEDIASARRHAKRLRNLGIFAAIVAAFLVADQVTKAIFNAYEIGHAIAEPIPGVIGFKLVHNTGGAWGVLGDLTFVLMGLSVVVCVAIVIYLFVVEPSASVLTTVGLSMVFAGGIGNLIDRIANGYVIDFIQPLFIDFPVFNIADIGVTCGVAITFISLILDCIHSEHEDGKN